MPPSKPHFYVDPSFPNSKEVLSIPRRYRLAAVGAWCSAGAWCTDKQTDGWVPVRALSDLGVTPLLAGLLVQSTLWIPAVDNGVTAEAWQLRTSPESVLGRLQDAHVTALQFDNWPKWQKTKQQWRTGASSNARRQAAYRNRRAAGEPVDELRSRNALRAHTAKRASNAAADGVTALRDGLEEKRREDTGGGVSNVSTDPSHAAEPPPPKSSCPKHPAGTAEPCNACRVNRERTEREERQAAELATLAAANKRQRALERLAACPACDTAGWVLDIWGDPEEPARRCQHPGVPE